MMKFEPDHQPVITELVYIEENEGTDWAFPLHQHADRLEISFVAEGAVDCYLESYTLNLKKGDLLVKNAGLIHAEKKAPSVALKEICISFDGVHPEGLPLNCLIEEDLFPIINTDKEPLIRELVLYMEKHQETMDKSQKSELARMLVALLRKYILDHQPEPQMKKEDAGRTIRKVKEYLDSHYAQKISLDDLGEMFYISPFYLTRQFKKFTGYTVKQYILDLQMGEAEKLLMFSKLPVKEIAMKCGYDNLQYFYVLFKKYAQCTPVEYRRKYGVIGDVSL